MAREPSGGRRQLLGAVGSTLGAALAGCTGTKTSDTATPTDGESGAANAGGSDVTSTRRQTTSSGDGAQSQGSCDVPTNGEITTLAEYECVTANREEWLGREVSSTGRVGSRYREEYVVFKHQLESEGDLVLPFFVKTAREFTMGTTYAFSGTVERIVEMGDRPSIFLVNPSFERP